MPSRTATCLINNYNYAAYVGQAVESALSQSVPFEQIIVVDDGSTDDSVARLQRIYGHHPQVEIVTKRNQGQLSCFNEGVARARGDVVFFLDADDQYEPHHVERTMCVYEQNPKRDFVFCGYREFGDRSRVVLNAPADRDLGYSVALTAYLHEWIGAKTSCLSMRRGILEQILPLPFVENWRTRADDCLIFGASLAGARKYYVAEPLVRYRVHGGNSFCRHKPDEHAVYRRRLAINQLFEYLERKFSYNVDRLGELHHREFHTIAEPTLSQLLKYLSITTTARLSTWRRLGCALDMAQYYLRSTIRPTREAATRPHLQRQLPFETANAPAGREEAPPASTPRAA